MSSIDPSPVTPLSARPGARSRETAEVVLGAVCAGLAVLRAGDHLQPGHPVAPDLGRIRVHLEAVTIRCAGPAGIDVREAVMAVRSACVHLQVHELADAYLALHTAHTLLTDTLRDPDTR